jgi:hypothetical protein
VNNPGYGKDEQDDLGADQRRQLQHIVAKWSAG